MTVKTNDVEDDNEASWHQSNPQGALRLFFACVEAFMDVLDDRVDVEIDYEDLLV